MIDGCLVCRLKRDRKAHQPTMAMYKKNMYEKTYHICNDIGLLKSAVHATKVVFLKTLITTSNHDIIDCQGRKR